MFVLKFFKNFAWFKRNQIRKYGELNVDYPGAFACRVLPNSSLFTRFLSLAHTHTLSLSLSLSFSLPRILSHSLSLSLSLYLSFSGIRNISVSLSLSRFCWLVRAHTHSLSLVISLVHSLSPSHPFKVFLPFSLSPSTFSGLCASKVCCLLFLKCAFLF